MRDLKNALGSDKIISVSVATKAENIRRSYNVAEIVSIVDFINLRTYNLRGASNGDFSETAFHSPLYSGLTQIPPYSEWNINSIVENWVNEAGGADIAGKLIIGVSTFGRSFTLENQLINGVGAPATGIGNNGRILPNYSEFRGILGYREICRGIRDDGWIESFNLDQGSHQATFDDQWVGYDGIRSTVGKIIYARDYAPIGGVNYVRLEFEDWSKL